MTWWAWTGTWVVLVALGAALLYLATRRLFHQGMALARELGTAADAFAAATRALEAGAEARAGETPRRDPRATRTAP